MKNNLNGNQGYSYFLCFVDGLLIIHHAFDVVMKQIDRYFCPSQIQLAHETITWVPN
jgi:hypothetical protein